MRQLLGVVCAAQMMLIASVALALPNNSYIVKNGDTLSSIAHKKHVPMKEILKTNHLSSPNKLKLGMKLILPCNTKTPPKAVTAPIKTVIGAVFRAYKVKNSDNLWSIARSAQISYKRIAHLNGILKPSQLKPGMIIKIPIDSKSIQSENAAIAAQVMKAAKFKTTATPLSTNSKIYRVKKGDTAWTVGKKFHISWKKIAHFNNLKNSDHLILNSVLKIPTSAVITKTAKKPALKVAKHPIAKSAISKAQIAAHKHKAALKHKIAYAKHIARLKSKHAKAHRTILASRKRLAHRAAVAAKLPILNEKAAPSLPNTSIVKDAYKYRGVRYRYGGTSSRGGFDCSGFTQYLYKRSGTRLPRTATQQARLGSRVTKSGLNPGDLIFFHTTRGKRIGHVGMYVGSGKFIHASSGGGRVRVDSLSSSYYSKRFVTARHYKGKKKADAKPTGKEKQSAVPTPVDQPKAETKPKEETKSTPGASPKNDTK